MKADFKNVRKILMFRLCCLGDVAMLTPVINNLHLNFPDAEIKIASSKWVESLLPHLPYVTEAVIFDAPFEKNFFSRLLKTIRFILKLRKEKFDLAFLAHRHNYYGLILWFSGIRYRLGFSETKYLNRTAPYDHKIHFAERHLKVLTENGLEASNKNLILKQVTKQAHLPAHYG